MSIMSNTHPLCPAFNQAMLDMAHARMPGGFDVIPDAPETLEDLRRYYTETGRVAVNSANQYGLVVGSPEPYYAFRAWHDLLHVENDGGDRWTIPGEATVADAHRLALHEYYPPEVADYFADLIEVEVVAANSIYVKTGEWPTDERAFAIGWLLGRGWTPEKLHSMRTN